MMKYMIFGTVVALSYSILQAQAVNPFTNVARHTVVYFGGLNSIPANNVSVIDYEFLYILDSKDKSCYLLMRNTKLKTESLVKTDKASCK